MEQGSRKNGNEDSPAREEAEFRARAVLDGLSFHVAVIDSQGYIDYVNQAWRDFARENPPVQCNVCEGANYLEQCEKAQGEGAEEARRAADAIRDVLAGRADKIHLEYPCHSPTTKRWFSVEFTRYPGAGPPRAIVVHENITERKLVEEALRASQERFRDLTERTSDWVWEVDERGVYTYASPRVRELLGYEPDEVVGRTPLDFMSKDEATRIGTVFHRITEERAEIRALENTLVCKDGRQVIVETRGLPIIDESGNLRGYRGIDRDITERKLVEAQLQASEERFRSIVETTSEWIWELDLQGRHIYTDPAIGDILGYSADEVLGLDALTLVHEDDRCKVEAVLEDSVANARGWRNVVIRWRHKDGSYRWLESNAVPVLGINGEVVAFRGADRDVTERKRAEEDLAYAAERNRHIAEVLQQTLIPPETPVQPPGYEIAARYKPALHEAEVCGDFYDVIDLGDGRIGIVVGDLVGKGLPAAARTAAVRQTIRSYALVENRPAGVMTLVSDALIRDTEMEPDMLTAFFAVLDIRSGRLTYTNAGHEPPMVRHPDGSVEALGVQGPMLSRVGGHDYTQVELALQKHDLIVIVTDGITEARIAGSLDFYGAEGIIGCLANSTGASAEEIAAAILEDATSFAGGELRDDAAIVVIRKLGGSADRASQGEDKDAPAGGQAT